MPETIETGGRGAAGLSVSMTATPSVGALLVAGAKTGVASLFSMAASAAAIKVVSVMLGPAGLGVLSLLQQARQTITVAASSGGDVALAQGVASRTGEEQNAFVRTVGLCFVAGTAITATLMLLFAAYLSHAVLKREDVAGTALIRWLVLPVVLVVVFTFLTSVLTGFREIGALAWARVIASLGGLVVAYPACRWILTGSVAGYIVLLSAGFAFATAFALLVCARRGYLRALAHPPDLQWRVVRSFYAFSGGTLLSGIVSTGSVLLIRIMVLHVLGIAGTGLFDVAWTLSMTYVMFVLGSFHTYYSPSLSGTPGGAQRVQLISDMLRLAMLASIPLIAVVIVLKPWIIQLMYSPQFVPALDVVRWMLIGDFLKVASWSLGATVLAYADVKVFVRFEIVSNVLLLGGSAISLYGFSSLEGIGITFIVLYACSTVYLVHYCRSRHGFRITRGVVLPGGAGLIVLVLISIAFWSRATVPPAAASLAIAASIAATGMLLHDTERAQLWGKARSWIARA